MKRFILSLTAAAVLSMPMAASALEKMDNNQLKSSTGQAGVSIAVDDVVIYQKSIADTTYWDTDGLTVRNLDSSNGYVDSSDVGAAGIKISHHDSMQKLITIDAILDDKDYGVEKLRTTFGDSYMALTGEDDTDDMNIGIVDNENFAGAVIDDPTDADYSSDIEDQGIAFNPANGNKSGLTTGISPLTIDVGTCEVLTAGWDYNTGGTQEFTNPVTGDTVSGAVAGVVIGLPTVEITTYNTDVKKTVSLELRDYTRDDGVILGGDTDVTKGAMNLDHNTFLEIEKSGASQMAILGGTLEIAPH